MRPRALVLGLKCVVAAVLLAWLVGSGRFDVEVYRTLATGPHLGLLALTTALLAVAFGVFVMRWWGLARAQALPISVREVARTGLRGLFTQLVVPGGVGTDGIRLLHLRRHCRERLVRGIASLLSDRLSGLAGLVLLGSLACVLHWRLQGDARLLGLLWSFGALIAIGLAGLAVLKLISGTAIGARRPRLSWLAESADALHAYARRKDALAVAVGVSMLGHALSAAAACVGLAALGETPPVLGVFAVTSMLNLVRMIPLTPLGLGVADGAAEFLFGLLGLSHGAELQMLTRVLSMGIFLLAGLSFLVDDGARRDDRR